MTTRSAPWVLDLVSPGIGLSGFSTRCFPTDRQSHLSVNQPITFMLLPVPVMMARGDRPTWSSQLVSHSDN